MSISKEIVSEAAKPPQISKHEMIELQNPRREFCRKEKEASPGLFNVFPFITINQIGSKQRRKAQETQSVQPQIMRALYQLTTRDLEGHSDDKRKCP